MDVDLVPKGIPKYMVGKAPMSQLKIAFNISIFGTTLMGYKKLLQLICKSDVPSNSSKKHQKKIKLLFFSITKYECIISILMMGYLYVVSTRSSNIRTF